MKYKNFMLWAMLFLGFGLVSLQAQEAILSAGGDASGSGGSISCSVGQLVYTTNTATNGYSVAEGVQQPYEISVIIGVEEDIGLSLECLAYPNPVKDHLTLRIVDYENENLSYQLYDMNGNLLESEKLTGSKTKISMEEFVTASYFLRITDNQKEIKIFKIIKN